MQIRKRFKFEAAHVLPNHPGKCSQLHGHSYRLDVAVEGPVQTDGPASGMVIDFDEISDVVKSTVIDRLDHTSLNDLIPNPTAENIAIWTFTALLPELPQLVEVVVWETRTACAIVGTGDAEVATSGS